MHGRQNLETAWVAGLPPMEVMMLKAPAAEDEICPAHEEGTVEVGKVWLLLPSYVSLFLIH